MLRVGDWFRTHCLSLALAKTEVMILTKKRMDTVIPVSVGGEVIQATRVGKYLRVSIDSKMNFFAQICKTADKAAKVTVSLSRLMANTIWPSPSKRSLLITTVQSTLLYGAECWAVALDKECFRIRMAQVQRRCALRVACTYSTVSEPAVLVITGVVPIKLVD